MPRKTLCLFTVLFILFTIASPTYAQDQSVFGPKGLTIRWWHMHLSFHHFTVDDPGDGLIIITKNTPQKKNRGGFLLLNRSIISIRNFLIGSDTVFEKTIPLRSTNRLMVFLRGRPGTSITIEVRKKSLIPPPEVTFSANPSTISLDDSSTLTWTTTNAKNVSIDQGIGNVAPSGTHVVSPTETTTYTITATGPGGTATDSAEVLVVAPPEDVDQGIPEDDQQGGAGLVGETICILNGTNVDWRSGLAFPSPNSLGLSFEAFYNSRSQSLGTLGYGWTHTYDVSVDTAFHIGGRYFLRIVDQKGRAHYFLEESPGLYRGAFKEPSHVTVKAGDYVWYRLDGTRYGFSSLGQLLWIEDEKGDRLELNFNGQVRLDTVADMASGRMLTFHYNGNGLLDYIEGPVTPAVPDGIWVTYSYDSKQNLISVTYADASGFTYAYTDPNDVHNLTEKQNKAGHLLTTWSYDDQDRAVGRFSVEGKGVDSIAYVSDTQVDVTDAYGTVRTYSLGEVAGRKRVTALQGTANAPYSESNVVRWVYDDNLRLIETESANGTINQYQDYDEKGNPATVRLAVGTPEERVITYTYHPDINLPLSRTEASVLGSGNKVTIWDYDDDYDTTPNESPTRLLSRIVEQGFTKDSSGTTVPFYYITTFTYNAKGQVMSIDGPLPGSDDTTSFTYDDATGDLLSITQPLIGTTTFSDYGAAGMVAKVTDVNGQSKGFTYDGKGRTTAIINDADGSSTIISYNAAGQPDTVTDEDGVTRSFDYDSNGRLSRVTDMEGNYIAYAYDGQGNRIEMSKHDPSGLRTFRKRWSHKQPEIPGKLWKEIDADDTFTEYGYDSEGNIASMKDPNGYTTYYAYDPLNRLTSVTQPGSVTTTYAYDAHGNLTGVTDANDNTTSYTYDDMGRLVSTTSPDTGAVTYVYDEAGNFGRKTDAKGITVQYTYDTLNRLTAARFADHNQDITYTYDEDTCGKGYLTGITDPSGSTAFTYDLRGRLIGKTSIISDHPYTITRAYTPGSRVTSITYPSGRTVNYPRYPTGEIEGISTADNQNTTTLVSNLNYLPFGPAASMDMVTGDGVKNVFDELHRIVTANPGTQTERIYEYDGNGNIISIQGINIPWYKQNFTYDALNQLVGATGPYGTISYSYDTVGNRLTRTINDQTEIYTYLPGTNKLHEITGPIPIIFTYDENGNTTGIGTKILVYNQNNRLIRVEENNDILGEYTYNALGQRVIKEAGGTTTIFHYDFDGQIIAESLMDGTVTSEYLYVGSCRLAKMDSSTGTLYHYLNNYLGTPLLMTDGQGVVVWDATYRPFGEAEVNPNSTVVNNFRFPGQYYDQDTGLHYNYFRDYHPGIGRYVEPDPIGLRGGINMYAYCLNDPVNMVDPSGQIGPAGMVIGAISGGIAGFVAGAQAGNIWAGVVGGAGGALIGGFVGGVGGFAFSPEVGAIVGGIVGGVIGGASGGVIAKKLEDPDAPTEEKLLAMAKGAGIGIVTGTTGGLIGAAGLSIGATGYAVNLAGAVIATPIACVLGVFSGLFVGPDQEGNLTASFWPPEIAYPLDWFPSPDIYTSGDTVARNSYVDVWVDSSGSGCPPYSWSVSGTGFHFGSVEGLTTAITNINLETLQLWADDTACGSAIITVADSCRGNEKTSVREPSNGGWYLVAEEQCSHWERDWCCFCYCVDTFEIGAHRYQNIWIGDKACQMTEESCGPYPGGQDLRGNGCWVVGFWTPAYCNTFFKKSMWEWRCAP